MTKRNSADSHVNSNGRRFVAVCQQSGLRVLNGRSQSDPHGSITFQNRLGTSVIDYAAVHFSFVKCILDFLIENFNEFSDHTPIVMSLRVTNRAQEHKCECKYIKSNYTKWDENNKQSIIDAVDANVAMLDDAVDGNESIDDTVDNFISALKSIVNPFCAQTVTKRTCNCRNEYSQRNHIDDKPWFTEECKTLYLKYKYELRQFNKYKTKVNRLRLADAKKHINA